MQVESKDENQMPKYVIKYRVKFEDPRIKIIQDDGKDGVKEQLAKIYCV